MSPPHDAGDDEHNEDESTDENDEAKLVFNDCPPCQHEMLVKLYHEALPTLPAVKTMNSTREGYARGRWRETWDRLRKSGKPHDTSALLDYFARFFAYVGKSDFLMGRVSQRDRKPFEANFEWLMRPCNFAKVIEEHYHSKEAA